MDRLTFNGNFCDISMCREMRGSEHCKDGSCSQRKVWERLKKYEDAEEQGLCVRLPCAVGQTVFVISKCENVRMGRDDDFLTGTGAISCPFESTCDIGDCDDSHIRIFETVSSGVWYGDENGKIPELLLENIEGTYTQSDFGKTVFLTCQEAEKALEEIK